MPASGNTITVIATRSGFRSDPNEVEIVVVEHADGVTICAVYPSTGDQANECTPGAGGRNSTRNNDVKVTFDVQVPAGVRFAGRMVNGSIRANDLNAEILARTVNGSVRLSTARGASAKTVNGSITASFGETSWEGEAIFETVNGSVRVDLPEGVDADVEMRTASGRITTDVPDRHDTVESSPRRRHTGRWRFRAAVKDGQRQHHPRTREVERISCALDSLKSSSTSEAEPR